MYKLRSLLRWYRVTSTLLLILAMMLITITVQSAYRVQRPITDGKIHQWNLYGENDNDYPTYPGGHKGIDFPAVLGTDVYAVAPGSVVDVVEGWPNGSTADNGFGNLVLIRHTKRHWVRHSNGQMIEQWGYVYSIYGHLAYMSVTVNEGDTVTEGQKIAEVDDTGASGGHHLHYQIDLDPSSNRNSGTDYDWTETHSRNPEIWLPPYDNGSTQTATAVGKVTDASGNPVGGLQIHGMQKPDDAIWNPSQYPYGWSETYNTDTENPDDILVENFATTDVAPGTYHLEARYSNGTLYEDLGWHTFVVSQTTYIGLYPVYLPDIRRTTDGWVSNIVIRNNSETDTAQVNTTFFRVTGSVADQRTDSIGPQDTVVLNPPAGSFSGSAVVAASQDVAIVVENLKSGEATNYNGITPANGLGNTGWGQAGTTIYAPAVKRSYAGRTGILYIFNAGSSTATVTPSFRARDNGTSYNCSSFSRSRPRAALPTILPVAVYPPGSSTVPGSPPPSPWRWSSWSRTTPGRPWPPPATPSAAVPSPTTSP